MFRKTRVATVAILAGTIVVFASPALPAGAAGDGVIATMSGSCAGVDANTSSWNWTKPTLEVSSDGTSFSSANGSGYGVSVCRETTTQRYWFQILKSDGTKELGAAATNLTFRVTVPPKSGDTFVYASGYSNMTSFSASSGSAVIVTKPAALSKINFDSFDNFKSRHPECASVTTSNWYTCNIQKSDEDFNATVIQHISYSTSALTTMEQNMVGLWVGANVNGFQIAMSCGSSGVSGQALVQAGETVTVGGKTWTKQADGTWKATDGTTITDSQMSALFQSSGGSSGGSSGDGGANIPGGSSGGSGSSGSYELRITMQGTPHFKADGVTLNKGSMKAFITSAIAKKCFGDGKSTTTLADIAAKLSVKRNASGESESTPTFAVDAVTSPAEGLLVTVAEMTFSNPEYTIKSALSAYVASNTATTQTGTSTTTGKNSYALAKSGTKATISVTLAASATFKVYRKTTTNGTASLVKTVSGKKGLNKVLTTYKKGYIFIIRSSKGTQLATLK
jgi:hypothetical protein